jgi:L-2-hydroxyglutarate oxidase LhgO
MTQRVDVVVIGGGIVGLATARALLRSRNAPSITVVEKETVLGAHQTGRNSGVLHSGLYYRPGSLKARLCVEGRRRMAELCRTEGLPYRESGKVVVATTGDQVPVLEELARRGEANGLQGIERLGPSGIRDHEPHATGAAGLFVPETGYVDFGAVADRFADHLRSGGVPVSTGFPVSSMETTGTGCVVHGAGERIEARMLINCGGLHADTLAAMTGLDPPVRIVPFRGEYFHLRDPERVASAVYPVPDPRFPFLGVHFTRRIDDTVEVGPNAVLAWGREHYRGTRPRFREMRQTLRYRGFWRMAARYWRTGIAELAGSWSPVLYARRSRVLIPGIRREDLIRGGSGVRAQAVWPDGTLADDFVIAGDGPFLHVLNAPSPAATAALEIGDHLAGMAVERLGG